MTDRSRENENENDDDDKTMIEAGNSDASLAYMALFYHVALVFFVCFFFIEKGSQDSTISYGRANLRGNGGGASSAWVSLGRALGIVAAFLHTLGLFRCDQWFGCYNLNVLLFDWTMFFAFNIMKNHLMPKQKFLG